MKIIGKIKKIEWNQKNNSRVQTITLKVVVPRQDILEDADQPDFFKLHSGRCQIIQDEEVT
jgi:hypothetical protein